MKTFQEPFSTTAIFNAQAGVLTIEEVDEAHGYCSRLLLWEKWMDKKEC